MPPWRGRRRGGGLNLAELFLLIQFQCPWLPAKIRRAANDARNETADQHPQDCTQYQRDGQSHHSPGHLKRMPQNLRVHDADVRVVDGLDHDSDDLSVQFRTFRPNLRLARRRNGT